VDRYGKAFDTAAATVGDVKTVGADLAEPRQTVQSSAESVNAAADELTKAKQELAEAEAALAAAKSGKTATTPSKTSTTAAPLVPPATVDRVKQAESDLTADTAAVQSTLKLAGYWTGPVDGKWTPELTDALIAFQKDLGVKPTGAVDAATLSALERAIAEAQAPPTSPTAPTTSGSP
jgi:murein L,D-transpeptidase YcbB/YkuD